METTVSENDLEQISLSTSAKDSWVNAYINGNLYLPQSVRVQNIQVGQAVIQSLKAKETTWKQFFNSTLSPEQITTIKEAITKGHNAYQISETPEKPYPTHLGLPLPSGFDWDDRVKDLWEKPKDFMVPIVLRMIPWISRNFSDGKDKIITKNLNPQQKRELIENFFDNHKYDQFVDILSDLFTAAGEAIKSPISQEAAKRYREGHRGGLVTGKHTDNINERYIAINDSYRIIKTELDKGLNSTIKDFPDKYGFPLPNNVKQGIVSSFLEG